MAKFKNKSPLGALEIPYLGQVVEPDAEFEVPDEIAVAFVSGNFEPIDAGALEAAASVAAATLEPDAPGDVVPVESDDDDDDDDDDAEVTS